jgi:hypothetical protein
MQPVAPTAPATRVHGHYRGTAALGDDTYQYHAEALIAVDGVVRLYVGGPVSVSSLNSGAGLPAETLNLEVSTLFVGNLAMNSDEGIGDGAIFGQNCAAAEPGRFCDEPALAEIRIARTPPIPANPASVGLAGEIQITTNEGEEIWLLDLAAWSIYYNLSASSSDGLYRGPVGMFREELAEFVQAGDVIATIDTAGRLFFQSPDSGCIGNGTLAPHADGKFYVFDVNLLIESCDTTYAFLNGEFEGLATETQDNYWGYDNWLIMFLSTANGSLSQAAITMIGSPIY